MLQNLIIKGTPLYMVSSSLYGYHLYDSLVYALKAILDSTENEEGKIYNMIIGYTYQDSKTRLLFNFYKKNGSVTLETTDYLCIDVDSSFEDNQELIDTLTNLIKN